MSEKRTKACGIDVHKNLLVATILDCDGNSVTRQFRNTLKCISVLKTWVIQNECDVVAFESTGNYYQTLYRCLYPEITVEVANAYYIKHVPGKKTDTLDSQWIAQLALNKQIPSSRIFTGDDRDFRLLTRHRKKLVEDMTFYKNIIHVILESADIHLSSVLTNIFGVSGMLILEALVDGKDLDSVFAQLPPRIQYKKEELKEAISGSLNQCELLQLRSCLDMLSLLTKEREIIDTQIANYVRKLYPEEYAILCSIPGIGFTSASVILSEIGDIHDFMKPDNLASWAGLVPSVYQSAGVLRSGSITKHGNEHLRWIAIECAHSCARKKGTHLHAFFERVKKRAGYKKAIVALARKLLVLIWHLLINKETYKDEGFKEKKDISIPTFLTIVEKIGKEEALKLIQMGRDLGKDFGVVQIKGKEVG